jgi:aminomuconate-semialdehyde/2-hydroxymuconate-6-semialdehyde dehydrogenase
VEEKMYDQFKKDFIEKVAELKVGNPSDENTHIGALVSKEHLEKVKSYIDLAAQEGGTVLFGGNKVAVKGSEKGYYLQPTIIEVKDNRCRLNQEEIFGPVVTILSFKTDEEALHLANEVKYGLSSTLWTNNLNRTMQFSKQLQTGIVWVNTWMLRDLRTPFGGQKDSGVGREGGFEALRFFTEAKNICIQYE